MVEEPSTAWTCIVCSHEHREAPPDISREAAFCSECTSSLRNRASVLALQYGLAHEPRPISGLAPDWSRHGLGCSDHYAIASRLPSRLSYTNTYLHQYPRLDILNPPAELLGAMEFVLCSDVIEHVEPPYQRAYEGLFSILRHDGFAVVSLPLRAGISETVEHYPEMLEYEVVDGPAVRWRDTTGREHVDEAPEMHGGDGLVLAFRSMAREAEIEALHQAGFASVWEMPPHPDLGVFPLERGNAVFLARKIIPED